MTLPPITAVVYNKKKLGYFGELGKGANARIRFLQSAVTKDELDHITLIEKIPGSDRWDIRDLFQRDVDMVRVESSILPYLQSPDMVKFFNPLTLVLIPVNAANDAVDSAVPFVVGTNAGEGEHQYTEYEREGLYKYKVHKKEPAFSEVHWNDVNVKLVAIDGQHRLSALQFWKESPGSKDLDNWQIPVVILGVFRADDDPQHAPATLLEIVRKTFVYINSKAEEINEARLILLNDEDVQAVCTQEFVQASHQNDCLPDTTRNAERLPLFFIDWRGQDTGSGSVVKAEEIHNWFKEYLIGEHATPILQLDELDPPISESYVQGKGLTHADTAIVRKQCRKIVYPGLSFLLERFLPYRDYIKAAREFEAKKRADSEAAKHAFQRLRFGGQTNLLGGMKELVDQAYSAIVDQLETMRHNLFDELVDRDIGMRAIIYAFATLKKTRDDIAKRTLDWKQHAEWFVPAINAVYTAGWFRTYNQLKVEQRRMLTHICYDPAGTIINYKTGDVPNALGSVVALLVLHENRAEFSKEQQATLWNDYGDPLSAPLRKGFRKEHKARLKDAFQGTQAQFIAEVNKSADESTTERVAYIHNRLMKVAE